MIQKRKQYLLFFIGMLTLLGLACRVADNPGLLARPDMTDTEEIVGQAVATIEARPAETSAPLVTTSSALSQLSTDLEAQLVEIYNRVNPAVVHIFVYDDEEFVGSGSGFVMDTEGFIVTNNHVIADGSELEVVFPDGQRQYAELVGADVDSDLAVIRVAQLPLHVMPVPLGDSGDLQVGQFVVAIGNPFGEDSSMSVGIISGLGRTLESQRVLAGGFFSIPQVIQTDAAINPGNSGGPLLNLAGEVVGVNSAILSRTGANSGVGFSIPVNAVRNIAPALVEEGRYDYPYIGISMRDEQFTLRELELLDLPPNGVWVTAVHQNTPAEAAGLIGHNLSVEFAPKGDYIIAIDGRPIRNSDELLSYLVFETRVGDTVEMTVIREGKEVIVPLTLGERP